MDDAEDYRAMFEGLELGTEATRTGIIDNAIKSRYIALKKDVYTILPDGKYLIEQLLLMGINMDKFKTATTGKALKQVFRGEMQTAEAVAVCQGEIQEVFEKSRQDPSRDTGFYGDEAGVCPLCGKSVVKGKFSYGCRGYKEGCTFRIPLSLCRRPIPIDQARLLLREGKTKTLTEFYSARTGKNFDAALRLEEGKVVFDFT